MSRSYHATLSQSRGKSKGQLDDMAKDADSILSELATKLHTKRKVKTKRKELKVKKRLSEDKGI